MSVENVEIVRRLFAAFSAGDMDAFMALLADDAVVQTDPSFPEGGTLVGRAAIRRFHEGLHEGWRGGGEVVAKDVRTAGDRVLASYDWTAIGEASGIETSSQWYLVFWLPDGRIARFRYFRDHAEALEAAGLSE
jgi:uncharacterized protein (TIGR02246 family)